MVLGIQADDLTGACDTGAPFAARGLPTVVLLPGASIPEPTPAVVVRDTESRTCAPAEARRRAREAVVGLRAVGASAFYKKVDSTLRGAPGDELAGVLEGGSLDEALLAPAFPAQRRVLVDGVLRVEGVPAAWTPLSRDPTFPRTGAAALALLGARGPHPAGILPLTTLRQGIEATRARLGRGLRVLVADAETDADLDTLAAAAHGRPVLLSGSAGLAGAVARALAPGAPAAPRPPRGPLVAVVGSAHPRARSQALRLGRRAGAKALIAAPAPEDETGESDPAVARQLAVKTRVAVEARRETIGVLLLTGGETALAVCHALSASALSLAGELEPGLALGALLDGPFAGLPIVTKAGAFGDDDTLVRVWEACA